MKKRILPPGDPSRYVFWRYMKIVDPDGNPYLDRLYIFRCPLFGLMLHKIRAADFDRTPHNHPWGITQKSSFWSYVVKGGYTEELATILGDRLVNGRTETHRRGWHAFGLDDVHRISAVEPGTVTFVVSGRKRSGWGFWVEDGMADYGNVPTGKIVSWRDYLDSQGRDGNGAR